MSAKFYGGPLDGCELVGNFNIDTIVVELGKDWAARTVTPKRLATYKYEEEVFGLVKEDEADHWKNKDERDKEVESVYQQWFRFVE